MEYFSVSAIRLFSKSSPLCVKSIPSVWRICAPVGIVVQTHAGVYDALGRQKCFLPLSYLLNQSPPHVLLFQFVCTPKHLSHTFSSWTALWLQQWNANAQKLSPCLFVRIANLLLDTFLQVCAAQSKKSFKKVFFMCLLLLHYCIVYAIQYLNGYSSKFCISLCPFMSEVLVRVTIFCQLLTHEEEFSSGGKLLSDSSKLIKSLCSYNPH